MRTQIGVSGFRVDLGIVHPDFAGAYLAGLECDGAQYHSSATARDRDKVRQAVLEGLGWTILRIWSTDWFRNAPSVVGRIHEQLTALLEDDRERRAREATAEPATIEARPDSAPLMLLGPLETASNREDNPTGLLTNASSAENGTLEDQTEARSPPLSGSEYFAENSGFQITDPARVIDPDRFFDASYAPILRMMISEVIAAEAPLPLARLSKEIAKAHGWQRTGHRIVERVERLLGDAELEDEFGITFVWKSGERKTRTRYRGVAHRSIREISRTEIASVVDQHGRDLDTSDDPILELARLLGIARLSRDAREYLDQCKLWSSLN